MRARFWIESVNRKVAGTNEDGSKKFYGEVVAVAVQRAATDDDINWAHYTPVGKLTMTVNDTALPWWMDHQGEDVYLDLSPVPASVE